VHNITLRPISAALLPKSFSRATSDSFEEDIPTIYHEVELEVMVETSTKSIPHPVLGSGLYDSEHVGGSEKTAGPSVPREKENPGVSFEDAKRTRQFNIAVFGGMSSVPSKTRILICSAGGTGKTALIGKSDLSHILLRNGLSFSFLMVSPPRTFHKRYLPRLGI
jgi:hypothetical protein